MAAFRRDPDAEAATAVAVGEERLRRHRAARDHARSTSNPRGMGLSAAAEEQLPGVVKNDSRPTRARSRQAHAGSRRRSPSEPARRPRGIPRGASRGEANAANDMACAPHRQEPEDLEARWQAYTRSEEFVTFQAAVESLNSLPSMDQLTDRRVDFEVLLHLIHRLGCTLEVEHVSKSYRAHYSPDVQLSGYLYSTLLTAFTLLPSYVLNGQEFYVSDTVLDQCKSLQMVFQETCTELKKQFESLQSYSLEQIRNDVKCSLVYFDRSWSRFEMPALEEIEAIHRQACRPLIEAIEADQALISCESRAASSTRGSGAPGTHRVKLQVSRSRLMEKLNELNRLANIDGKGRSDMDMTCVLEAERIAAKPMCMHLRRDPAPESNEPSHAREGGTLMNPLQTLHRCSGCASPVLLRVAQSLIRSLKRIRRILQRYANCLYQLNSHLANNSDLVRGLELFESAWETANSYLVQSGPRRLALLTYDIVAGVQDADFEAALNNLDPGFLVASLPRALILHEMGRFAAAKAAALAGAGQGRPTAVAAAKPVKSGAATGVSLPKIATSRAAVHATAPPSMLQRPLDTRRIPSSAYQHSPIARAFLPADVVDTYNEAATALERLPSSRLPVLCSLLTSPPRGSSGSTPLPPRTGSHQARHMTAETLPMTPCPPRMAVPNASRPGSVGRTPRGSHHSPQTSASAQVSAQAPSKPMPEESDDEDDEFAINLSAQIQNVELGALDSADQVLVAPAAKREGGQDPAIRRVVMTISTLALHLQRTKAHEWNELIQVVLQGFMLAKSARKVSQPAAAAPAASSEPRNLIRGGEGLVAAEVW